MIVPFLFSLKLLCLDANLDILPVNNEVITKYKHATENGFEARAHIKGRIGKDYSDTKGHTRFQVVLTNNETIELVYNDGFGNLPKLQEGMEVEACGDYITSNKNAEYPASPDGAIIHYVHVSTNKHLSGFVVINSNVYGQLPKAVMPSK